MGLSVRSLKSVGADHSLGYHSHLVLNLADIIVELYFAHGEQPVQLPSTVNSIARTSELLRYDL